MAKLSGNRWVATLHRVRSSRREGATSKGRYSVPFFFEPGLKCVVKSVDGDEIVYGEHVLEKMKGWVEFQELIEEMPEVMVAERMQVEVY